MSRTIECHIDKGVQPLLSDQYAREASGNHQANDQGIVSVNRPSHENIVGEHMGERKLQNAKRPRKTGPFY